MTEAMSENIDTPATLAETSDLTELGGPEQDRSTYPESSLPELSSGSSGRTELTESEKLLALQALEQSKDGMGKKSPPQTSDQIIATLRERFGEKEVRSVGSLFEALKSQILKALESTLHELSQEARWKAEQELLKAMSAFARAAYELDPKNPHSAAVVTAALNEAAVIIRNYTDAKKEREEQERLALLQKGRAGDVGDEDTTKQLFTGMQPSLPLIYHDEDEPTTRPLLLQKIVLGETEKPKFHREAMIIQTIYERICTELGLAGWSEDELPDRLLPVMVAEAAATVKTEDENIDPNSLIETRITPDQVTITLKHPSGFDLDKLPRQENLPSSQLGNKLDEYQNERGIAYLHKSGIEIHESEGRTEIIFSRQHHQDQGPQHAD